MVDSIIEFFDYIGKALNGTAGIIFVLSLSILIITLSYCLLDYTICHNEISIMNNAHHVELNVIDNEKGD